MGYINISQFTTRIANLSFCFILSLPAKSTNVSREHEVMGDIDGSKLFSVFCKDIVKTA